MKTIQNTASLQNTKKSPGDLRRLAVTQTPVKDHHLTRKKSQGLTIIIIKRTCQRVDFNFPADQNLKLKEIKKKDKYLDLARELKKNEKHESDGDTIYNWRARYSQQAIDKGTRGFGNKRTSGNHPNYSIKISKNTKKSPGDLRRLAVIQ